MPPAPDRLAIVTGTSSGIGEALARRLLNQNWNVIGLSRRAAPITGPNYHHVQLDLGKPNEITATLDARVGQIFAATGLRKIGLVNNAADVALLGQLDRVDPAAMLQAYATNTVAPVTLMGWVLRSAPASIPIRIVNVSSGAAVEPLPGLGAYGATKAALRLAGMILGAELDAREATSGSRRDVTIWSYEPGIVETPMQRAVRSSSAEQVPIVQVFHDLKAAGKLAAPEAPAAKIAAYLEGDGHPRFAEERFYLT